MSPDSLPISPGPVPSHFTSICDVLFHHATHQPLSGAYQFLHNGIELGPWLSYASLNTRSRALAVHLLRIVAPGDRVILVYPAGLSFVECFLGCLHAGIIPIPAPSPEAVQLKRALPRLRAILEDAEAAWILTDSTFEAQLRDSLNQSSSAHAELLLTDKLDETLAQWHVPRKIEPQDLAYLQYSSGSTGTPKGIMITHGNLMANLGDLADIYQLQSASRTLNWLPHHHDYGLVQGLLLPLYAGSTCYIMSPASFLRKPLRWLEAISTYKITHSQGSAFAYGYCLQKFDNTKIFKLDLGDWRVASLGAEPINPEVLTRFGRTFLPFGFKPLALMPAYGLAEATLGVTMREPGTGSRLGRFATKALRQKRVIESDNQEQTTVVSCGKPLSPRTRVIIVDPETRQRCSANAVGEIWVDGPSVAQGYWRRPEDTERTFLARLADTDEGPFLRTGDLGFIQDAELFVVGRQKDLIIIRGQNHHPTDIEFVVEKSHPRLRAGRCAAFSVSGALSEQVVVVAELLGGTDKADYQAVTSAINEAIGKAAELTPRSIVLIRSGSLPITSSGKIQRQSCRHLYEQGQFDVLYQLDQGVVDVLPDLPFASNGVTLRETLREGLLAMPDHVDHKALRAYLRSLLADVMRTSGLDMLNGDQNLLELGIDSVASIEFRSVLEEELRLTLPIDLLIQHPTLNQLEEVVRAKLTSRNVRPTSTNPLTATAEKSHQPQPSCQGKKRLLDWQVSERDADYDVSVESLQSWDRVSLPPDKSTMRRRGTRVITDDWKPAEPLIQKDTKVLGMGSCFTRDIVLWLAECGFNQQFPGSPYNALLRYPATGNNAYLAEQFRVLAKIPSLQNDARQQLGSDNRFLDTEDDEGRQLFALLKEMDVLFLTLGGVEAWRDIQSGKVLKAPLILSEYSPARHRLEIDGFADTLGHLQLIDQITQEHFPDLKIIFTLPLGRMATYRPLSALNAASSMAATLRAALGEFLEERSEQRGKRLHYFPAYELFTQFFTDPYQADNIHATPYVTGKLCASFAEMFCKEPPRTPVSDSLADYDIVHSQALAISLAKHDSGHDDHELKARIENLENETASLKQVCQERLEVIEELNLALGAVRSAQPAHRIMNRLRQWLRAVVTKGLPRQ